MSRRRVRCGWVRRMVCAVAAAWVRCGCALMQSVSCVWAAVSARCWASVGVLACRSVRVSGVPLRVSRVWVMVSVRACGGGVGEEDHYEIGRASCRERV